MNGSHSKCKICQLPDKARKEINRQLIGNGNLSALAQHYNVSRDSLYRHRANHIGPAAVNGVRRAAENYGVELLQDMKDLMQTSKDILQSSLEDGHRSLSLKAIKEIRANTEVLAKIIFSMDQQATQGLDQSELADFRAWRERKNSTVEALDLSKLSDLERSVAESMARKRIQQNDDSYTGTGHHDEVVIISETIVDVGPVPDDLDSFNPIPTPPRRMRRRKKP